MKKVFLLIVLFLGLTNTRVFAQTTAVRRSSAFLPGETDVVRDSSGSQYGYREWMALYKSGKFSIKAAGKTHPGEYLIYPLYTTDGKRIITAAMKRNRPAESEQFRSGDVFRPFNERAIDGEKFNMKKMPGKIFVINFWFIGCPPCRAEIPDLNEVVDHYKDNKDVVFIAICLDQGYDIKDFTKLNPYNYHIIADGKYLAQSYGVHLYPTNVVVNKEGKVAYSSVGGVASNPYWMEKTIDEALQSSATVPAQATPTGSK